MMYQMYESQVSLSFEKDFSWNWALPFQYDDLRGTIYGPDSPDFHPAQASEALRKALSGMGKPSTQNLLGSWGSQVILETVEFLPPMTVSTFMF